MNKYLTALCIPILLTLSAGECFGLPRVNDSLIGNGRKQLIRKFGEENLRSYHVFGDSESITFDYPQQEASKTVTFYLTADKLTQYKFDDREEMTKQYLSEFASGNILFNYPKQRTALLNALQKLPLDIYLEVTDRRRPIIFIDYYTAGIAQYAGSMEFRMRETDPSTFGDGFYIIRMGDGLNDAQDEGAIEGIVLHEIMHRYLEHLRSDGKTSCELEKEANQKLKELGFEEEYKKASEFFGAKKKGDSPCSDELFEQTQTDQNL